MHFKYIIIIISSSAWLRSSSCRATSCFPARELEICSKTTLLLQCLSEHLIFTNIIIRNRTTSKLHCLKFNNLINIRISLSNLFEVFSRKFRNRIFISFLHQFFTFLGTQLTLLFFHNRFFNRFSNSKFASTLADFIKIGTRETNCCFCQKVKINIACNWSFTQICLKDLETACLVWKWNVNKLVKTSRTKNCRVNDIGTKKELK
uniref:Candidate secreted effector n=1 Tax=Meloidogyne incognita TaxID=6306 RepID=A0A914MX01_MELIC